MASVAMSKLLRFYKSRGVLQKILGEGSNLFETENAKGIRGETIIMFRPKSLRNEAEIDVLIKQILEYVWQWGDYIRDLAIQDRGLTEEEAKTFVWHRVKRSNDLQILQYLVNEQKHATLNRVQLASALKPRYGRLITTFLGKGEIPSGPFKGWKTFGENVGSVPRGTGFGSSLSADPPDVRYSIEILDVNDKRIGDALAIAEKGSEAWVAAIEELTKSTLDLS